MKTRNLIATIVLCVLGNIIIQFLCVLAIDTAFLIIHVKQANVQNAYEQSKNRQ